MRNYQRFLTAFFRFKQEFEEKGLGNFEMSVKKKFYKKIGLEDVEKIKQLEVQKTNTMNDRIELSLSLIEQYGSLYEIDEVVRRYILLNKPPNNQSLMRKLTLPFNAMFIETQITKDDANIGVDNISGLLLMELPTVVKGSQKIVGRSFIVYYLCEELRKDGIYTFIDQFTIDFDNPNIFYDDHKTLRFLKKFVANTLLFFNDREVEWVKRKRSAKNKARRIKKGKLPLPDSRVVRLTGRLKKYIDSVSGSLKSKISYSFWVSGHWRELRSNKYKNKKGQWIKIEPYEKGKGSIRIKRSYQLKFDTTDPRKEEVGKDVYFADIKPLKKPLRSMRDPKTSQIRTGRKRGKK